MATYTITTAVNIDSLAAKVGSDTYNINGGYLTVDQDTRYGTNQNTSAALGNITMSATLGGTIEFNSTKVRLIPYNTGTGNVPAYGTTISRSGASGILLCVYSALNVAPTAVGVAMPAAGYIKIRQWNSTAYTAGALTGIGASATGADVPGWLEIVGVNALAATVNRLNLFKVRGDWFEVGTTDGTRATTYQAPSNGAIVYLPGVWVETGTATGVYDFYPCAGSATALAANFGTDEVRGRLCWISTAGLIRFGHDGTNSTGGFIPQAGRRIRIPSIVFSTCTAAGPTANVLPNATLATRYRFTTTGGGVIDVDKASVNWNVNFSQPYSVTLSNVGIMTNLTLSECASAIAWSEVGVGQEAANTQYGLQMSLCFAGGTMDRCTWTRALIAASGNYVKSWSDMSGFTITNERLHALAARGNANTGAQTLVRVASCTFTGCVLGGGKSLITTCQDLTFADCSYYDNSATNTISTLPCYAFELLSSCVRIKVDGLDFGGLNMVQPYSGIMSIGAAGCSEIKLRNLGTAASPLDLGSPRVDDATWTRATTTATVTSTAHGLATNDIIYVIVSSSIAAITVASKTVTVTGANTFTFVCLNAGAASGTLSYFGTMCANLLVIAASAAANDVQVKRCYCPHTRTNLYTGDNSSKGVRFESVYSDYINAFLIPMLNCRSRGVSGTPLYTAQTACYGTHWVDGYNADLPTSTSAQAWARTTTTATVTSTNHKLRTGLLINVGVSSDTAAIRLGQYTVTVVDSNTFTFTCLNAGATSGTLTYDPLIGKLAILMNEATEDTDGTYTLDAGAPAFTSAGGLYMPTVADQVTFIKQENLVGVTAFPIAEAVMAGGTIGNYRIEYAADYDGTGYGSFYNLYYARAGGGGSNGSTNVTMTDTTGVVAGDYVWGTNIGPNAKVTSVTNGTTVVVDNANIGAVSGTLRFNHLPSEVVTDAEAGFLMKWRITTSTTNATTITSIYVFTSSTTTSRAYQYPLDPVTVRVTAKDAGTLAAITGGAVVYLEADVGGPLTPGTVIANAFTDASGVLSMTYPYTADQPVIGRTTKRAASPLYGTSTIQGTIDATGLDLVSFLVRDE